VIAAVSFSPDGKRLATGGTVAENNKRQAEVLLWDAKTWEVSQVIPGQDSIVNTLAFSPDGKTLAIGTSRRQDGSDKASGELKLFRLE
jgi:WD40 repeat protein